MSEQPQSHRHRAEQDEPAHDEPSQPVPEHVIHPSAIVPDEHGNSYITDSLFEFLRRWLVVRLIRWADRGWTASYAAYVRCDKGELPWAWERFWTRQACRIERISLGLAQRLDPGNQWRGAEMVEQGWWG